MERKIDNVLLFHIFLRTGGRGMECVMLSVVLIEVSEKAQVRRKEKYEGKGKMAQRLVFFLSI